MKKNFAIVTTLAIVVAFSCVANAFADNSDVNIPITAEQAFDAVVQQKDPLTGDKLRVGLVDVRTSAEYFWVGACGKVESIITTSEKEYIPHNGKVKLKWGKYLFFKVEYGKRLRRVYLPLRKVEEINTTDISVHVPLKVWNEEYCRMDLNQNFQVEMNSLAAEFDVLILMCRSGKRSNDRSFDTGLFQAVYEIDQPDGSNGQGGFQGSSFGDVYNGYRGFPGRSTRMQSTQSVSWSDAGLPVHIGWTPFTISVDDDDQGPQ